MKYLFNFGLDDVGEPKAQVVAKRVIERVTGIPTTRMKTVASNVVKKRVFELFTPFNCM
ncbi:hypothetical protein HanPSC8_Chr14g0633071 [Helianthus annuus]|nr:hypothetical protein HanPSC8_Chr14g0633071 [Helianthus annuus]